MNKKQQILIISIIILFIAFLSVDNFIEKQKLYLSQLDTIEYDYAKKYYENYNFLSQDPLTKLEEISQNRSLNPGTYEVRQTNDEDLDSTITPGVYIFKNEDYNNKAKIILNNQEFVLGGLNDQNIHINYVELNLKPGDIVEIKKPLSLKKIDIIKENNE